MVNSKKKILIVFGTRPEAIKMAPLILEFKKYKNEFETFVCVTGQHREMLDSVLSLFEIVPDFDLNIMKHNQDLYELTSRVLLGMRSVLSEVNPEMVFVHGDTSTSTIAALSSFYHRANVAHVEAGLRTYNKYSPWPEEMNRMITGSLASVHFAPTRNTKENLLKENIEEETIYITGNTVIDALKWGIKKINDSKLEEESIIEILKSKGYDSKRLNSKRKLILITGHRRENFGEGLLNICNGIKEIAKRYSHVDFVYPVHLNPKVDATVRSILGEVAINKNIFLLEPLEYLPFIYLMDKAYLILTDSGGIQEEAPSLGKPVLVMRNTTERPEAVSAGTVKLIGTQKENLIKHVSILLNDKNEYQNMISKKNPYGEGDASKRIVEICRNLMLT